MQTYSIALSSPEHAMRAAHAINADEGGAVSAEAAGAELLVAVHPLVVQVAGGAATLLMGIWQVSGWLLRKRLDYPYERAS